MPNDCISYIDSGYFSKLLVHYLEEHPELQPLYNRFPKIEHFKEQIAEKARITLQAIEQYWQMSWSTNMLP
jgi:hypothetical protein